MYYDQCTRPQLKIQRGLALPKELNKFNICQKSLTLHIELSCIHDKNKSDFDLMALLIDMSDLHL